MPRKMVIRKDGNPHSLSQVVAANEEELQELVKENPDILPFEEYGFTGPLMIVGRETTLPSGSVDLVGLARGLQAVENERFPRYLKPGVPVSQSHRHRSLPDAPGDRCGSREPYPGCAHMASA